MKYSIAFAAAVAVAQAATSIPLPYGGGVESSVATTAAPATTPAPETPETSTAFVTDEVTVISCGPEVTNCPGKSTEVVKSTYAAPPPQETTPVVKSTYVAPPPKETTPVVKSTAAPPPPKETTPVATSTPVPATSAVPQTSAAAPPPPPPAPKLSTQAVTTCVPTTIYQTVTVVETSNAAIYTTPVATSKAIPYATGSAPYASGAASGTGVAPKPTGSPIASSNGAAGLSASFGGMALAAVAAVLFA